MDGHFIITGAANIGLDAGNTAKLVIEVEVRLLVDVKADRILPPMAKDAAVRIIQPIFVCLFMLYPNVSQPGCSLFCHIILVMFATCVWPKCCICHENIFCCCCHSSWCVDDIFFLFFSSS